jgi:DNA-binding SARP family transcriptional activator
MATLTLKLFGAFQALLDGAPVSSFATDKTRALLAYLAVEAVESDRPHRRETLAGLLWPDAGEAAARGSLSQCLSNLSKVLREGDATQPLIVADRDTVRFNHASTHTLDVAQLTHTDWRTPNPPHTLVSLYAGPLLEGFVIPNADGFEEWLLLRREAMQRVALEAFDSQIATHLKLRDYKRAIELARHQLALDSWREETHRNLMQAYVLRWWPRRGATMRVRLVWLPRACQSCVR